MRVLHVLVAVDPGQHIGIATRYCDGTLGTWMIHNRREQAWELIAALRPTTLVVERFITSGRISAPGLETVEIAGSIYALAWAMGATLVTQTPAQRYPRMKEAKETLRGTRATPHQIDALAHLLVYEVRERIQGAREPAITGTA